MYSVFLSSYRNTRESLGELEKAVETLACGFAVGQGQTSLLYLPTQIRFLIGGERVKCHWSKLNDALGRTKHNDALGKQQLELWTRT